MNRKSGYLKIYIGGMFSGKTTRMRADLTMMADIGMNVLFVNHFDDTRAEEGKTHGDTCLSTHSSEYGKMSDKITSIKSKTLSAVDITGFQAVGIDESQFFDDLIEYVWKWVNDMDLVIIVAGLDGDAFMKPIGKTLFLIPIANDVIKLHARCRKCIDDMEKMGFHLDVMGIPAPFTMRTIESKEQKIVGGAEIYAPVCRYHFFNK